MGIIEMADTQHKTQKESQWPTIDSSASTLLSVLYTFKITIIRVSSFPIKYTSTLSRCLIWWVTRDTWWGYYVWPVLWAVRFKFGTRLLLDSVINTFCRQILLVYYMMIKAFYLDLVIQMSIVSNLDHEKHATRGGWNGLGIGRNGKYYLKLNKKNSKNGWGDN